MNADILTGKWKQLRGPILFVFLAAVFVACAATDSGLTLAVKSKLAADPAVKASRIEVTTQDKVVTLTGNVESQAEKDQAIRLARETSGVVDVLDRISVRTSEVTGDAPDTDRSLGRVIDDAGITASVKKGLLDDPGVRGLRIDVDTREGIVYLTGVVGSTSERDRAVEIARSTKHVRDVQADLRVEKS